MNDKEKLTIEEMEAKLKKIEEDRLYYNECIKQKKAAEESKRKEELEKHKDERKKEIDKKQNELVKLITEYTKDYGSYRFSNNDDALRYFFRMFL